MTFYGFLRDLERAANAAERERIRKEKEMHRIEEANRIALEKQQKINYLNSQQHKANIMTGEIVNQYKIYSTFKDKILSSNKFFSFEKLKKNYVEATFEFDVPEPQKNNKSERIKIPKESKLETKIPFLKNRRLSKIAKKEEMQKLELEQYENELKDYEIIKQNVFEEFKSEEQKKQEELKLYNDLVDKWKNGCINKEKNNIDKYMAHMFKFLINITKDKIINKLQYDLNGKRLICEIYLKKEKDLFPCEGYRYIKQKDTIEPILTKRTTINTMLKEIIPNVGISFVDILYKNDELNLFNEIIVNVYYERKCCSSIKLSKHEYNSFNLTNEDSYYYVYDHYMKNYKTLSTGVKPYDSIFMDLV